MPTLPRARCSQSRWLSRRRRRRAPTSSATFLHKPSPSQARSTPRLRCLSFSTTLTPRPTSCPPAPPPPLLSQYSHVNRLLTSHSFRRDGAQHANGSAELTDRWIFDRGARNVSTTNKAFNYVFNTRAEDHKVAKVLSGWSTAKRVPLADLAPFDTQTREQITAVQERLFASCRGLGCSQYNVSQRVLDVLTAVLLAHYPLLKQLNPNSPAVLRIETSALNNQRSLCKDA